MPCYVPPHGDCHHGIEDVDNLICDINNQIKTFDRCRKREEGEFQELKKYANNVTDMLCRVLTKIDGQEMYDAYEFGNDIGDWWKKHKEWDEKRKK